MFKVSFCIKPALNVFAPLSTLIVAYAVSLPLAASASVDVGGSVTVEYRFFPQSPALPSQLDQNISVGLNPELNWQSNDNNLFSFTPFVRVDQDDGRQHVDVRELLWIHVHNSYEVRVGINKVFWGVTESQHLVDIVNQSDFVESIDGDEKLGQPMLGFSMSRKWGLLDIYVLPYFRERTFSSEDGRFYIGVLFPISFAENDPIYESRKKERHIDFSARWSYSFERSDVSISYFQGTNRNPEFELQPSTQSVHPVYYQADRVGLEYQYNIGDWLLKLEAVNHNGNPESFNAVVGGFEYTLYGVFDSVANLGLLYEYNYNSRGFDEAKAVNPTVFQDDSFFGARFALNDVGSTSLLAGIVVDHNNQGKTWFVEAARRFGNHLKVNVEARGFEKIARNDALFAFKQDDYIEFAASWYF